MTSASDASTGALPPGQRIATLDILRGFALMGILIMNMLGFSANTFAEADGSHLWPGALDQAAEQVRDALFSGKFNSMFSLLFGIGFTIQFARMQQQDPRHASGLYLRRLAVLGVSACCTPRCCGPATCCMSTPCWCWSCCSACAASATAASSG